jgi:hypothetical protein
LGEALDFATDHSATMFSSVKEFAVRLISHIYEVVCWVVPNFPRYDAVESLVNGRNVGLVWVLQAVSDLVLIKTLVVIGAAMLLFHRREVAEISV